MGQTIPHSPSLLILLTAYCQQCLHTIMSCFMPHIGHSFTPIAPHSPASPISRQKFITSLASQNCRPSIHKAFLYVYFLSPPNLFFTSFFCMFLFSLQREHLLYMRMIINRKDLHDLKNVQLQRPSLCMLHLGKIWSARVVPDSKFILEICLYWLLYNP